MDQPGRIRRKLKIARKTDSQFKVFGARMHRYKIGNPIAGERIAVFERDHGVSLPDCYTTFVTEVGNGGCSHRGSAAGPFYGIYPFGQYIDELAEEQTGHLRQAVKIYPGMTDEYWAELCQRVEQDSAMSESDYNRELGEIYAGILPLGSQGCQYLHGLVLNGPHGGKVVNLDLDHQKPRFTYEGNFLDWYERWLDEIISGDLLADGPSWFGYSMGGSEQELLSKYHDSSCDEFRLDCLKGLLAKRKLSSESFEAIESDFREDNAELIRVELGLLAKIDYTRAKPILRKTCDNHPLQVFQCIFWYARPFSEDWVAEIEKVLSETNISHELFRFASYLIAECQTDLTHLVKRFMTHHNLRIQSEAIHALARLEDRTSNANPPQSYGQQHKKLWDRTIEAFSRWRYNR
ncbi:MAG: SMI1/KNR4 family protein [Pirellulales bacterium]|nr:SMI1/KNR4 family protein [Pirellulales bacterium]